MHLAKRTLGTARPHPALRCVCGRRLTEHDLDLKEIRVRLICSRCHRQLFEFVVSIVDNDGERW